MKRYTRSVYGNLRNSTEIQNQCNGFRVLAWAYCIFLFPGNSQDLHTGSGIRRHASFIINARRGAGERKKKNGNMRKFYKETRVISIVLIVLAFIFYLLTFDSVWEYTNHKLNSGQYINWVNNLGLLIWFCGIFWIFIRLNILSSSKSRVKKSSTISLIGTSILFICILQLQISFSLPYGKYFDIFIAMDIHKAVWPIGQVLSAIGIIMLALLYPHKSLSFFFGWAFVIISVILIIANFIPFYNNDKSTIDLWRIIQPILHLMNDLSLGLFILGLSKQK